MDRDSLSISVRISRTPRSKFFLDLWFSFTCASIAFRICLAPSCRIFWPAFWIARALSCMDRDSSSMEAFFAKTPLPPICSFTFVTFSAGTASAAFSAEPTSAAFSAGSASAAFSVEPTSTAFSAGSASKAISSIFLLASNIASASCALVDRPTVFISRSIAIASSSLRVYFAISSSGNSSIIPPKIK